MFYKRFSVLVICVFIPIISTADVIMIDKIAARINDEIITFSDIVLSLQFYTLLGKKGETEEEYYLRALQDLIHYKVINLEYKDHYSLIPEDFIDLQTSIINKMGSYTKLMELLRENDMDWLDFQDFISEKILYERVLEKNFQVKITINFSDIESYYKVHYLPSQRSLQLRPKSLIEMAPQIENQLKKDITEKQTAEWLKKIMSGYDVENILLKEKK